MDEQKRQRRIKSMRLSHHSQLLKQQESPEYTLKESSSSFHLKDVIGFIYGGKSSRFWMLRKHVISLDNSEKMPFYAWECVTV